MILVKRGTLAVMLVIAAALGVGLGSWGASAVDLVKPPAAPPQPQTAPVQTAPLQPAVQAPVVPAALPVASGSFAKVAEAVGPAVVNVNTFARRSTRRRSSDSTSAPIWPCSGFKGAVPIRRRPSATRTRSESATGCSRSARLSASSKP